MKIQIATLLTIAGMLFAGFGWTIRELRAIDGRIADVDKRLAVLEATYVQK